MDIIHILLTSSNCFRSSILEVWKSPPIQCLFLSQWESSYVKNCLVRSFFLQYALHHKIVQVSIVLVTFPFKTSFASKNSSTFPLSLGQLPICLLFSITGIALHACLIFGWKQRWRKLFLYLFLIVAPTLIFDLITASLVPIKSVQPIFLKIGFPTP